MKTKLILLSTFIFIFGSGSGFAAGQVTRVQTGTWTGIIPNSTPVFTFDQHNASLGVLQSITIKLSLNIAGGSLFVDNDGAAGGTTNLELGAKGKVTATAVQVLNASAIGFGDLNQSTTGTPSVTANINTFGADTGLPPVFHFEGDGDNAILSGTAKSGNKSILIGSAYHSGYIGASTYDLSVPLTNIISFTGVSGLAGFIAPVTTSGTIEVTYQYHTPEPGTYVMLLTGIGLIAVSFRRRKRAHASAISEGM